jgi:hypothetical protein
MHLIKKWLTVGVTSHGVQHPQGSPKNLTENGSETDCRTLEEGEIMLGVHNPLHPEVEGMLQL